MGDLLHSFTVILMGFGREEREKYYMSELNFCQSAMIKLIAPPLSRSIDSAPNFVISKAMVAKGGPVYK